MSQFSLILLSTLSCDLPFRTEQTITTETKNILFHHKLCEKALEIFCTFIFSFV